MTAFNDNYRELTLDNGLRVVLQNTPTRTISGRLRVFHGGLHERVGEEGLAHFLEHTIMTGGGRKYSPAEVEQIKNSFGEINAGTNSSETAFPVGMLAGELGLYLDLISDIVFHPRLDPEKVNQERQRVLRETADRKSSPVFQDNQDFMNALYGANAPQNYFVLGKEDVVARATPDDLRAFHQRGYSPNNMDLILVGGLPDNTEELVAHYFGDKSRGSGKKYEFPRVPDFQEKVIFHRSAPGFLNEENPEASSAPFRIGLIAPSETADDKYAVYQLANVLGGSGKSRLFQRLSQEMGLAYGVGSSYSSCDNSGMIDIGGRIQAIKADEAFVAIFEEMDRLKSELVDPTELEKIKRTVNYGLAKRFESNDGRVGALEAILERGITAESHLRGMNAVTPELVQEAANKYFPTNIEDGKYVLLFVDPLKKCEH